MSSDQIVWLVLAIVSVGLVAAFTIALARGWVPRSNPRINARWTAIGMLIAEAAVLIGTGPLIAGASDDTTTRFVNIAFAGGILAVVVQAAGTYWDKSRTRS